jgi:hypothetical protein
VIDFLELFCPSFGNIVWEFGLSYSILVLVPHKVDEVADFWQE